jgi:hypothetical protein
VYLQAAQRAVPQQVRGNRGNCCARAPHQTFRGSTAVGEFGGGGRRRQALGEILARHFQIDAE